MNIEAVVVGLMSIGGIVFGFWSLTNDFYLGVISLLCGMLGFVYISLILQSPFGYGSWRDY